MRLKFMMTPKQVAELRRKLKRSDSPNRNRILMAENITGPSDCKLNTSKYHKPVAQSVSHKKEDNLK